MKEEKELLGGPSPAAVVFAGSIASVAAPHAEICICAAIKLPDGRVFNGHRHDGAIEYAGKTLYWQWSKHPSYTPGCIDDKVRRAIADAVQGFTTSTERFVDRYEGMRLQRVAGKPSAQYGDLRGDMLFSEDLY